MGRKRRKGRKGRGVGEKAKETMACLVLSSLRDVASGSDVQCGEREITGE